MRGYYRLFAPGRAPIIWDYMIIGVPLRLAFVCPFGLRPKATVSARALPMAVALGECGYEVALFVPPWDDPASAGQICQENGVSIVQVSIRGGPGATLLRLMKVTTSFDPDIVHFFKPKGYSAAVAQLLYVFRAFSYRKPIVLDADDWEGYGGWNDLLPYPHWQKQLFAWQEQWAFRHADALTVASEALHTIAWSMAVPPQRVFIVPNALPAPLPPPDPATVLAVRKRHNLGNEDEVVLLYTRFVEFPPSWPVSFLQLLRSLRPRAKLLVVDVGLYGQAEVLRHEAARVGLADDVVLVSWPGREALPAYVKAANVAIVPFNDSLVARTKSSVKLLELMSLGIPIVASAVGENSAYLGHGSAGLLIDDSLDCASWSVAVAGLLADPVRARLFGEAAAERICQHYLWSQMVKKVEAAYESVRQR